jgi:hypothetical protein
MESHCFIAAVADRPAETIMLRPLTSSFLYKSILLGLLAHHQ